MNILVIAYKFSPFPGVGARRFTSLVTEFADLGHTVDVITLDWPGDLENVSIHKNIRLHKIPSNYWHSLHYSTDCSMHFLCRIFRKLYVTFFRLFQCWDDEAQIWGRYLLPAAESIIQIYEVDTIIATGHPFQANYLASVIKKRNPSIRLIQDFRDPWLASWSVNFFKSRRLKFTKMQADACASADLIVTVTDHLCHFYSKLLPKSSLNPMIKLIPNGYDEKSISLALSNVKSKCPDLHSKKIIITHIGNISNGRDESFNIFLQSIDQLNPVIKANLVINFAGYIPSGLLRINENILSFLDFTYFGQVGYQEALDLAAQSDFVLHFGSKVFIDARSTKIYEYAAMNKTLISFNFGGELDSFIKKYSIGHSINLNQCNSVPFVLEKILFSEQKFDFLIDEFSYRNLAIKYINQIHNI